MLGLVALALAAERQPRQDATPWGKPKSPKSLVRNCIPLVSKLCDRPMKSAIKQITQCTKRGLINTFKWMAAHEKRNCFFFILCVLKLAARWYVLTHPSRGSNASFAGQLPFEISIYFMCVGSNSTISLGLLGQGYTSSLSTKTSHSQYDLQSYSTKKLDSRHTWHVEFVYISKPYS